MKVRVAHISLIALVSLFTIYAANVRPELLELVQMNEEGPLEDASHVVLVVALLAWGGALWELRSHRLRGVVVAVLFYLVVVLGEEIDWGRVYGFMPISAALESWIGIQSLHQSTWRPTSMFTDKVFWFGIPSVLWYGLVLVPRVRDRMASLAPVAATREEGFFFFGTVATYMAVDPIVDHGILNPYQLLIYVVMARSGVRVWWQTRTATATAPATSS